MTQEELNSCLSYSDVCRVLGYSINGTGIRSAKEYVKQEGLSTSHFGSKRKYPLIEKECPVCSTLFTTSKGSPKEKTVCSRACSNTYFRSAEDNPNWKEDSYRSTCFLHHKKQCVVCKEDKIVEVHHLDHNKSNNIPSNLIPLCPTHHKYWHSRYRNLIEKKVIDYVKEFKSRCEDSNSV